MRLRVVLLFGLLLAAAIAWWLLARPGSRSLSPSDDAASVGEGGVFMGLSLTEEVSQWDSSGPVFLQVDVVRPQSLGAVVTGADLRLGEDGSPWWEALSLVSIGDDSTEIPIEILAPRGPSVVDLAGEGAYLSLAAVPGALEKGEHQLQARLVRPAGPAFRSNPVTVQVREGVSSAAELGRRLAEFHLGTGHPSEALRAVDRALEEAPDEADLHGLRAKVLERLGDVRAAIDAYDRALELVAPGSGGLDEPPQLYLERRRALQDLRRRSGGVP